MLTKPAATSLQIRFLVVAIVSLGMLLTWLPINCRACDTAMICAWKRTFYAVDALKTPLRAYFVPRRPNWDCWGAPLAGCDPACQIAVGIEPAGFERLGRIPNDFELSGGTVGPPRQ
jgi:hypothetical protein